MRAKAGKWVLFTVCAVRSEKQMHPCGLVVCVLSQCVCVVLHVCGGGVCVHMCIVSWGRYECVCASLFYTGLYVMYRHMIYTYIHVHMCTNTSVRVCVFEGAHEYVLV